MKYQIKIILLCLVMFGCNSDKKINDNNSIKEELSIAQKIANAHGYENWKNVERVDFTFKVDRDTIKGKGRQWTWLPHQDIVYAHDAGETLKYNRTNINSRTEIPDRAFINDKFWMFVPFQLIWDNSATISQPKTAEAPISKSQMDMITITYPAEGGYTPGDAYDIYYDKNYMIKEWTFRKSNQTQPTLSNTFENYQDFNGIKIAIDHKKDNGQWNLNFADVKIEMKN